MNRWDSKRILKIFFLLLLITLRLEPKSPRYMSSTYVQNFTSINFILGTLVIIDKHYCPQKILRIAISPKALNQRVVGSKTWKKKKYSAYFYVPKFISIRSSITPVIVDNTYVYNNLRKLITFLFPLSQMYFSIWQITILLVFDYLHEHLQPVHSSFEFFSVKRFDFMLREKKEKIMPT